MMVKKNVAVSSPRAGEGYRVRFGIGLRPRIVALRLIQREGSPLAGTRDLRKYNVCHQISNEGLGYQEEADRVQLRLRESYKDIAAKYEGWLTTITF